MKRSNSKIAMVILVAVMLTFIGCGGDTKGGISQNPASEPVTPGEITLLSSENDPMAWRLFRIAKKKYPDISIKIIDKSHYGLESESDFFNKVAGEIMTGAGPDIISPKVFSNIYNAVDNGAFEDLTPYLEKDSNYNKADYSDAMIASSTFNGKQFFVPAEMLIPLYITTVQYEQKYSFEGKNLYEVIDIHAENNIQGSPFEHGFEPLFINDYATKTTGLSEPNFVKFLTQRRNLSAQVKVFNNTIVPFEKNPILCVPGAVNLNTYATVQTHTNDTPVVLPALDEQGKFTAYLNGYGINANSDQKENAYKILSIMFTMYTDIDYIEKVIGNHENFILELSSPAYYVYANKSMQKRYYDEIFKMYKSGTIYSAENSIIDNSKLRQDDIIEQYLSLYDKLDRCIYSDNFKYAKELSDYINKNIDLSEDELASLVIKEADKAIVAISE